MESERNELYPVFLKVHQFPTLIIGGGNVGFEKLGFLLKSSPNANVTMVAEHFLDELEELASKHQVPLLQRSYSEELLDNFQLIIVATDDQELNRNIHADCKKRKILVNVADQPEYCDFYMGGIVTKGHLKLAISTNGKSPTGAKRLRQFFEQILPEELESLLLNLNAYRSTIKGDFEQKVNKLNDLTKEFLDRPSD